MLVSVIVPPCPVIPMIMRDMATNIVGISRIHCRSARISVSHLVTISCIVAFDTMVSVLKRFVVVPMVAMSTMHTMIFAMPVAIVVSMCARFVKIPMCKALVAGQESHNKQN